ncbi:MAG: deoxyhypusine synthase [Euryarchaeota archaeon]|nr:deoxyhypusine synthase [Euryarchaeota archaeon]
MKPQSKGKRRRAGRLPPVGQLEVEAGMTVDALVRGMGGCGFSAGRLARAVDLYEGMLRRPTVKFLAVSGAIVPAGMRHVISGMIRRGWVDVVVTNGATLVHDTVEALGGRHYRGSEEADDAVLREQGINRIYDVYLHNRDFERLEKFFQGLLAGLDGRRLTLRQLTHAIGGSLRDPRSILRSAHDMGVPLFCPALADSAIGLQAWLYKQRAPLEVDAFGDMRDLIDICYGAERAGLLVLGGGVPKNFILQAMMVTPREGFDTVIQVSLDTPETGGLSGAPPVEAISWGKVRPGAQTVVVHSEVTLALPLLAAALEERTLRLRRKSPSFGEVGKRGMAEKGGRR